MNIFALNDDPRQAALDQCNKHIVKMPLESVQMLCTALRAADPSAQLPYRSTHNNHPCIRWVGESTANTAWLHIHARELCREYTRRYGRRHKSEDALDMIAPMLPTVGWANHSAFVMTMPDEWKQSDVVAAYRTFYIAVKSRFARWAPRARPPLWWPLVET